MNVRIRGRSGLIAATLLVVATLLLAAPPAVVAEQPAGPRPATISPAERPDVSTADPPVEPAESFAFDDTLIMFEEAGFTADDGTYAGLVVFENRRDRIVVHIAKNEPRSAEAIRVAEHLAATAPARVEIEYLDHAWSDIADLVSRLADPNDPLNRQLGLESVNAVLHQQLHETVTVYLSDPDFDDLRPMLIEGVRVTFVVAENTFVLSSRNDDALS